jgi:2-octaprenyl-6-methoxyphenol hydroxylase
MTSDVIILGGGPNGLAAALALGSHALPRPLRVLVLDARDVSSVPPDSRGTALTRATQNMLRVLGVWEQLQAEAEPMREVLVSDHAGGKIPPQASLRLVSDNDTEVPAVMVGTEVLHAALLNAAQMSSHIAIKGGFSFTHYETDRTRVVLHQTDGEPESAAVLIAADGRNSSVRRQMAVPVSTSDYGQTALSFAMTHSEPHNGIAEEHFTPLGVLAVLPLPGLKCSIVWGTSPAEAERLMALEEEAFNQALQSQLGDRLGKVTLTGRRAAYPLSRLITEEFVAPRVALLGDAAHAIHPLAGLGLNLGFKDAAALADCLSEAQSRGEDIGSVSVLERYQALRRFDALSTSVAMDGLNGLFVNDNPVLRAARGLALRVVDQIPAAKSWLLAEAAGLSQNNPRLMQGLFPG